MKEKILSFLAFLFIKSLGLTLRYKFIFKDKNDKKIFFKGISRKNLKEDGQILIAFFHQDEIPLIPYFQNKLFSVLVSHSKDGELMSNALKYLGIKSVRGSSSRGAVSGLVASIRQVKEGYNFALAVDGPRGPIYKVKEGIVAIQDKTKVKIIPMRAKVSRVFIFKKAWNKAKLPYPFTKITISIGEIKNDYDTLCLEKELLSL